MKKEDLIHERARRLEAARIRAGYKLAVDAAKAHGWNENTYRSHENGNRGMRFQVLDIYAKAFRTDPMEIWNGQSQQLKEGSADLIWHDLKLLPDNEQQFVLKMLKNMIQTIKVEGKIK